MSRLEIIRAWKDEEYFSNLSEADRMLLPQNPAGFVALSDAELGGAQGAGECHTYTTNTTTTQVYDTSTLTLSPA